MKVLWFDTETTGLDPVKNDIIQMAGIITVDGKVTASINFRCAPPEGGEISLEALKTNGYTAEEIKLWPSPAKTFYELIKIFDTYIDKFDKSDKLVIAGHNVAFDKSMLEAMAKKYSFDYLFSYIDYTTLDTAQVAMICRILGKGNLPKSNKLGDLCKHFGIELKAHDAWEDIVATRKLCGKLLGVIKS
jgi:DNA polymerase-3 subunit epsilon